MSITIKRGSWHHRLATVYSDVRNDDICAYTRAVIAGLMKCVLIVAVVSLPTYMVLDTILAMVAGVGVMDSLFGGYLVAFLIITCAFGGIGALVCGAKAIIDRLRDRHSEPTVIGEMYRSWRDKYCMRIQFKEPS